MKTWFQNLHVLAAFFAWAFSSNAQSIDVSPQDIQAKWAVQFDKLKSVSYTVRAYIKDADKPKLQLRWKESGAKYGYNFLEFDEHGKEKFSSSYLFDGERSLRSSRNGDTQIVKTGGWPVPPWVQNIDLLSCNFEFMLNFENFNRWTGGDIQVASSENVAQSFVTRSSIVKETLAGNSDLLLVQIKGTTDRLIPGLATTYTAKLDPKRGFLPVAWSQFNLNGDKISDFEVLEWYNAVINGSTLSVPKRVKKTFYAVTSNKTYKEPTNYCFFEFSDFSFDISESEFEIDPTGGRLIFDQDSDVWLTVPK